MAICILDQYLSQNVEYACEMRPVAGLESNIVFIKKDNISAITLDSANPMLITNIELASGTQGYKVEGVQNTADFSSEIQQDDFGNAYLHKIIGKVLSTTANNLYEMAKLLNGQDGYIAVVERLWKGVDANKEDAFVVLGVDYGLYGKVSTWQASANNGVALFELHSKDGILENLPPRILKIGDYATTKTAFDNLFVAG